MHTIKENSMPKGKDLKTGIKEAWSSVKQVFKPKTPLDQATVEKELAEFIKVNGYNTNDPNFDIKQFQTGFIQYLKDKNYSFEGIEARLVDPDSLNPATGSDIPKNIRKISEDLNKYVFKWPIYPDTTEIRPGMVVYVIDQIQPTPKKPWVTYVSNPTIITQIHDNGVNGGTVFLTYDHKFVRTMDFGETQPFKVVSEDRAIYTPYTKEVGDGVCAFLNAQSRILYRQKMKELMKKKQKQMLAVQKNANQNTK